MSRNSLKNRVDAILMVYHLCIKNFAKIICNTKNFSNFVLGNHSEIL